MSKNFEVQGTIHAIGETTEYGANGFTKREFVILVTGDDENPSYPNYVAFELLKDKCALMDAYSIGNDITVHFNLSGRLWSAAGKPEKCFNSLQAWRVNSAANHAADAPYTAPRAPITTPMGKDDFTDDIPF
jgi:hypothetical protein